MSAIETKRITRSVIGRGWPILLESVLFNINTFLDIVMVGSLGAYAVSAVGITDQPLLIVNFILMSMTTVIMTKISVLKGQNDAKQIKVYLVNLIVLAVCIAFIFTLIGQIYAKEIMLLMGAQPDIADISASFFRFVMAGICIRAVSSAITAGLRGIGETKTSMAIILISNASNILFNYLFIFGHFGFPRMGVDGAGLATCLSFVVGFILCMVRLFFVKKGSLLDFEFREIFCLRYGLMKEIFSTSLPLIWERVSVRLGVLITAKFTISIGTLAYAAHTIIGNLTGFSIFLGMALSTTISTFVGECVGRNDYALAKKYINATVKIGIAASSLFTVAFFFFAKPLAQIYTTEPAVIENCIIVLGLTAFVLPFQCTANVLFGAFRGLGDFKSPAKITAIGIAVIRPILTFVLVSVFHFNLLGAWIAINADELFRFAVVLVKYYKYHFENKKLPEQAKPVAAG
ncbi:MATE family efflux transporter [Paenibacillus thalictri]|uniref:Probable multidrug resistance protein NorM n=1 Tax=Paenibacillus thalictri TaxID=2527873 RepID=A0A4Q9DV98_9BACL|nr:MATE family efflux transporter [Paenibacillus thalictri]TBL80285.1 MATE family efflux transporter [Paenibacillus thalictri]